MANESLNRAKNFVDDEFYTRLSDIEKELRHYKKHFKGKTVLCNCDDPFESAFFKFFVLNFNSLQLKKLICTCYSDSHVAFEQLSLLDIKNRKNWNPIFKLMESTLESKNRHITKIAVMQKMAL